MTGRTLIVVVLLALATGACAGGELGDAELARPKPQETSTTTTSPPTALAPTTTVDPAATSTTKLQGRQLVLEPDGLGVVAFGDPAEQVVAELTERLGRPTDDRRLGSCPTGEIERLVEFAELAVLIGDREGAARFVAWDLGPPSGALPPLRTPEGASVGTTLAELRGAYGARLEIRGDDPFGSGFEIQVPAGGRLGGTLTGTGSTDSVATLSGGVATCGE